MLSPLAGVAAGASSIPALFVFFAISGLVVFGSGLAIVPFLHGGVVIERHWLTEQQFLDAVAISLLTPGPVVITVAFIGFLVAGLAGGLVAAVGVFLPAYLVVLLLAPRFGAIRADGRARVFASGVTAAAVGALLGAVVVMATRTLVDLPTAAIAVASIVSFLARPRVPEPLVLAAAAVGAASSCIDGRSAVCRSARARYAGACAPRRARPARHGREHRRGRCRVPRARGRR